MNTWLTVFAKEFVDNLRDRRTLLSALLFGPLFGPVLFGVMVTKMLDQSLVDADRSIVLTTSGVDRAPGLAEFLQAHGVELRDAALTEQTARAKIRRGDAQVILMVPVEYAPRLRSALPAPLLLLADSADSQTRKIADRARLLLAAYGNGIAQRRLQLRGVSPLVVMPIAVNELDVATPTGRAVAVLGFMTYFVLFAVLMGGLYLAIDSTAGERERGSLEALLSLPVARSGLVGGKLLATCAYMCLSLLISLAAFVVVFRFIPLETLGMSANWGVLTAALFFAICLPFVPLGAALMMLVASFTRSYREAQTYLTMVLLIPTLPIAFASIYSLRATPALMFIPSLSQHLLMTQVLKDEPLRAVDVAASAGSSAAFAVLLMILTARHWRRETMLG
ncbi:MAG: ABC transporter permease [Steroidobacteraceae bacterium]